MEERYAMESKQDLLNFIEFIRKQDAIMIDTYEVRTLFNLK